MTAPTRHWHHQARGRLEKLHSGKLIPLSRFGLTGLVGMAPARNSGQEFWPEIEESERVENHELSSARQNRA